MQVGIDGRAAAWYRSSGIGAYTIGLSQALRSLARHKPFGLWLLLPPGDPPDREAFWEAAGRPPATLAGPGLDIYHVPHNGLGLPLRLPCPYVITIHDMIPLIMPSACRDGYLRLFTQQVPRAAAAAARVITVSRHSRDDIVRLLGVPANQVAVTYEGIHPGFRPLPLVDACRRVGRYGLSPPYLLHVGGFSSRKNVIRLVEAYAVLRRRLPRTPTLVVTGHPGRTYDAVAARVARLGLAKDVQFTGEVAAEDMPSLYTAAVALVYPSLYEGFGLPPLEAMACGTPVVTSSVTSLPEITGDAALLADPYDVEAIAGAMERVLTDADLVRGMRERGLRQAARFSWSRSAAATLEVYIHAGKT